MNEILYLLLGTNEVIESYTDGGMEGLINDLNNDDVIGVGVDVISCEIGNRASVINTIYAVEQEGHYAIITREEYDYYLNNW